MRERSVVDVTTRVLVIGLVGFAAIVGVAGLLTCGLALRRQFGVVDARASARSPRSAHDRSQRRLGQFAEHRPVRRRRHRDRPAGRARRSARSRPSAASRNRNRHPGWSPNVGLLVVGTVLVALALTALAAVGDVSSPAPREPAAPPPECDRAPPAPCAARQPPVVLGTRFALEPGRGRTSVPVRSVRVACAVGVTALVAVLVWSSSLGRLVDDPHRWGWVADARVVDVTDRRRRAPSSPTSASTAVGDVDEVTVDVEGRSAPADAITDRKGSVGWTVLDGRMPRDPGEILLGARLAPRPRPLGRRPGHRSTGPRR